MIYVGVDIAKARHCVAAMDDQGAVVLSPRMIGHDAAGMAALVQMLQQLGTPATVRVGFEATGHYWVLLAEELRRCGWSPCIFNPILGAEATRTTMRGRKTDADDAIAIAQVLRDGNFVPLAAPSPQVALAKQLCRYRQAVVEHAANEKKRLIAMLDLVFPEFLQVFGEVAGASALAVLLQAPSARLVAACPLARLAKLIGNASRGRLGRERAQLLQATAKTSLARERMDVATELAVRLLVEQLQLLEKQIAAYDQHLRQLELPGSQLLQSIPGIGVVLATIIMAEIGTIDRFCGPDRRLRPRRRRRASGVRGVQRLLAFAGLDPRVCQSGQYAGRARMSKRGSRMLRTAIWRAAFLAQRHDAFRPIWEHHRCVMKQPAKLARSHVARKMVQAIYGVLRYQQNFDAQAFAHGVARAAA